MALDKVIDSSQLNNDLTSVAEAIRNKGKTTDQLIFPDGFKNAIQNMPTGETIPDGNEVEY